MLSIGPSVYLWGQAQIEASGPKGPISEILGIYISEIRSLHPQFWILWVKVGFSHYNQCDSKMSINQKPFEVET